MINKDVSPTIEELKFEIISGITKHLKSLGIDPSQNDTNPSKELIRHYHRQHRKQKLDKQLSFINKNQLKLIKYFADGDEVDYHNIRPTLQIINGEKELSDIFRFASLTWSVPVSPGYGRRMRFLVWDRTNSKLIGLFALGDPVINLKARDQYIGWNFEQRKELLVNILDAYVLGAVPPYNKLLGGKLIASLIKTMEVKDLFSKKYSNTIGIISGKKKKPSLLAVSTSSSLGRSSIYNRLKLNGDPYFKKLGFTAGWGHFQVPDNLFYLMKDFLKQINHQYYDSNKFGKGANWRFRVVKETLIQIGLDYNILRHGINREVYLCELASNAVQILNGEIIKPNFDSLKNADKVSKLALDRWVIPRGDRQKDYLEWKRENIYELIYNGFNN